MADAIPENPLISVIIPVYKVEEYLDRCLESVVHQTYKNLEIILVNDGSPDRCPELCDAWAARDDRIRVIHKENGGLSDARNRGLRKARGRYIVFVDSDDWISLTMVETLWRAIERYGADMAICEYTEVTAGGLCVKHTQEKLPVEVLSQKAAMKLLIEDERLTSHVWRKIYKRELIPEDIFPVNKYYEDSYIMHRLFLNCGKFVYLNDALYFYRNNPKGITFARNAAVVRDRLGGIQTCHRDVAASYPELRSVIEGVTPRKIFLVWQLFKELKGTGASEKALRSALLEEISRLRTGAIVRSVKGPRMKAYSLTVKLCPGLEDFFYRHLFVEDARCVQIARKARAAFSDRKNAARLRREAGKGPKRFWIFCTPEYGNLGDQALLFAEEAFVRHYFPDYRICKAPLGRTDGLSGGAIAGLVRPGDCCAIQAGGNFGTLYPGIHLSQEHIIRSLWKKRLFVFPQTFYYGEDAEGKRALQRTKEVYEKSRGLLLFARERDSHEFVRNHFPTVKTVLGPDMALYLPPYESSKPRHGVLVGIRPDGERTISDGAYGQLLELLAKRFGRLEDFDTDVYRNLSEEEAREELTELWERMAGAEAVVTDRLHGMVFAALTQTPCVLLRSLSHKIEGVYQWVKPLEYIQLARDVNGVDAALDRAMAVRNPIFDLPEVRKAFDEMAALIRSQAET